MSSKWKKKSQMTPEDWAKAREKRAQGLEEAQKKLDAGIEDLIRSGRWMEYLRFSAKFHRYTFFNTMLILLQRPSATRVAGLRTWNKLGRQVKKGEHGLGIYVPILAKARRKKGSELPEPDSSSDVQILDASEADDPEIATEGKTLVGFKIGYVFDESQTEGDPLPTPLSSLLQGDDGGLVQALTAHAVFLALEVGEFASLYGANGACMFNLEGKAIKIALLESLPPAHKAKTLAHELAHAALHSELEYRAHTSNSIQELEAESVAFMVMNHFGIESGEYSFGYLVGWAGGEQAIELIKEHGDRIYKAAFDIITWVEETFGSPADGIPVEIPITEDVDQTMVLLA